MNNIFRSIPSALSGAPASPSRLSEHCLLLFLIWAGQNVCCMYHITGRLGFLGLASLIGQTRPRVLLATNSSPISEETWDCLSGLPQPITTMMPLYSSFLSHKYCFKQNSCGDIMDWDPSHVSRLSAGRHVMAGVESGDCCWCHQASQHPLPVLGLREGSI